MTLFRQFFTAHLKGLLIWMAVGALFAVSGTRSAASFVDSDIMKMLPPALLKVMGDIQGLGNVDAYLALAVAKLMNLVPALYAIILALSVVTREVDRRTVEFLLALPVQRTQVLLARTAVLVVNVTLVTATIWAVYRFDMEALGYQGTWSHFGILFVNIWLLSLALGALTLAASMWIDDYSVGVKLFVGLGTMFYLVEYVLRGAVLSRAARLWSPFSYANPSEVMRTGVIPTVDLIVLLVALVGGAAVSFWAFNRKQFSA